MADFDGMISNQYAMIAGLKSEIGQLQEQIAELESLKNQFAEFQNKVSESASSSVRRIGGFGSFISSVVKSVFFSDLLEAVKGSEYNNALGSLESAQNKIAQQIEECQRAIQEKQAAINNCQNTISNLQAQKAEYERVQAEAAKQES